ncbi:hypothetical protein L218DRAFT_956607 [Marasmius fiardii PR-910]|nr:hypothetical protein L218DRAFT_956607 [Marasmius fiardii PR-910]
MFIRRNPLDHIGRMKSTGIFSNRQRHTCTTIGVISRNGKRAFATNAFLIPSSAPRYHNTEISSLFFATIFNE